MLLQSHPHSSESVLPGEISLLPALPDAWPAGRITGLRARGGFEVDLVWKDEKLTEATIRADRDGMCGVRYAPREEQKQVAQVGADLAVK